jgi:cell division protein FtsB|tara:strand:- start:1658 stop:1822 length:165 start_codon:yes stop_codon:yes gene_type:complete
MISDENILKLEVANCQKQIHDLQMRVMELSDENRELKRKAKLLDDLVFDRLMKK